LEQLKKEGLLTRKDREYNINYLDFMMVHIIPPVF